MRTPGAMKFGTEYPHHHTYPNEHATKVIVHNDNHFVLPSESHFMVDMLEIGTENLKEGNHGVKYSSGTEAKQEDQKNRNMDAYDCTEAPYSNPNSEAGLVVKEDYYVDKAVSKVEFSEIIASIDGGSCHGVENSSISEEMHSCESSLADEEEVGQTVPFSSDGSSNNDISDAAKEMKDTNIGRTSIATIDGNSIDPTSVSTSEEKCSCASSIEDRDKLDINDSITSNIPDEKGSSQEDQSISSCSDDQNHSIEIDQAIALSSAMEDSKEILSTCNVPSGVITFTFDPQEASASSREANRDDQDIQESKHTGPGTEGATFDGATTSARTSYLHLMQGESNFRGPDLLVEPAANSGHIPYSGSISIRSDSSTTSARSFAFPILQSEWNSSPVKMAKARPRGRKFRLCCRF